jgi:hypothetical protein
MYCNILTMHGSINVKSPNNNSKWQMGFNSAFKGLTCNHHVLFSGTKQTYMLQDLPYCFFFTQNFSIGSNSKPSVSNPLPCLFIQQRTAALGLIVQSWLDVPTFATRRLHVCHHVRAPSAGKWNCGREMSGNFT